MNDDEIIAAVNSHDFKRFMNRIEELALSNPESDSSLNIDTATVLFMRYKLLS